MQAVMKKSSSRQAGERVVMGDVGDVFFDTFSLSDVMSDAQKPQHISCLVRERGDDNLHAKAGPVLANIGPFGIIGKTVVCDYFEHCHPGIYADSEFLTQLDGAACYFLGIMQDEEISTDQLLLVVPKHSFGGGVHFGDYAIEVHSNDGKRRT